MCIRHSVPVGDVVQRRVLVIGSQCAAMPRLSFLPELATELYAVLTDPRLGGCVPALPAGGLLHDPTRGQVLDAVGKAFELADQDGATLLVALLGHGIARGDDFYYLSRDARGRGGSREDVHLSQSLKEGLRDSADLNGLLVLLDTCHAGVAARQAATGWGEVGLGQQPRRYELLSASADGPAYGGDFTRTLIRVLRGGVPAAGSTVDARYLREPLQRGAPAQQPQRVTFDGGGWAQTGDEGLWLAYNAALRGAEYATAGRAAADRVAELTGYLQPTATLDMLVAAAQTHRCVVVTGPRGSGKSTLAAALAHPAAARGHVPDGLVHAITFAARGSTLAILAAALAGQLTDTVPGFAQAARAYEASLDPAERDGLPALHRRVTGPLGRLQRQQPVRLVIDALDELPDATQDAVRDALAPAGPAPAAAGPKVGFVLTARPAAARPPGAHQIPVDQPGEEVIAAYLRQRGIPDRHLRLLVGKAGGSWLHAHLLAEQAVRPGFDPTQLPTGTTPELTALYEAELLTAGAGNPDRWQTQLRPVLAVLAVSGAGPVLPLPLAVAAAARLDGPRTTSRLRDVVARLSGLIVRSQPGQPDEQLGLFHLSLAEDYLLHPNPDYQFPVDPAEAHAALADAIQQLAPAQHHDPTDPLHRYALRAEPDHLWAVGDSTAVLTSLTQRPLDRARDELERWQRWHTLFHTGLGPEHPETLTVRANLASWTGRAGDAGAARDRFAALLPIRERVIGAEHPNTLTARANLAYWTGMAGDPAAARDRFAALLPILERIFGAEHANTLITRANLADWTGQAGDPAATRDRFAALLPVFARASGPDHSATLTARAYLAHWTGMAGDPAAARDRFAALLPIRERVIGPEHPDTLTALSNLAYWTGEAGDAAAARDRFAELLPIWERVSGPEHPDTLAARANLAGWTGKAGDAAAARDRYAELLPIRERVSGPEHPKTLTALSNLARWTGKAGDAAAARDRYAALLPILERVSGPEHPDTLTALSNLAHWTGQVGDPGAARDRYAALLPTLERISGPEHPDTLTTRAHLAHWTAMAGDPVAARDRYAALLPIRERVSGPEHPDTLAARADLARWTGEAGDPVAARDRYAALLPIRERVSGPEHPDTLADQANLAHWSKRATRH